MNKSIFRSKRSANGLWMLLMLVSSLLMFEACTIQPFGRNSTAVTEEAGMQSKSKERKVSTKSVQPKSVMYRLEPLHAFTVREGEISFTVTSTGCTKVDDFSIETEVSGRECSVAIYRTKADRCRRAPTTVELKMAWDIGSRCSPASVTTRNPISKSGLGSRKTVYK